MNLNFPFGEPLVTGVKNGVMDLGSLSDNDNVFRQVKDLTSILNATTDGILIVDLEGRIIFSNNAANHLLNKTPRNLVGTVFGFPLSAGEKTELQIVTKKGAVRIVEMYVSSSVWDGESLAVACLRDVTDHIDLARSLDERNKELGELNEALKVARDEALELSKLKSQFVANVSHEIRTPLAGIIGMADLLVADQSMTAADRRASAECINDSSRQLLSVLNDILDFSKLEAGRVVCQCNTFSVHELLETVYVSIRPLAQKKNLTVEGVCSDDIPALIEGDELKIRQCLLNLAHNAVKFTPAGHVRILASGSVENENTVNIRFAVEDSGIGVEKAAQARLFDPFVQADGSTTRRFGGTGLGLSIAKRYVELMGGEINLRSEPGKGSTFWFCLPLKVIDIDQAGAQP